MPRSVNKTQSKWCINKHGASKIIDTFETYQDGKKVSNHLMRDCITFLKLQEVVGLKQAYARDSIAYGTPPPPPLPNHGKAATQGKLAIGSQSNGGYT
jgi:hypothetical protein